MLKCDNAGLSVDLILDSRRGISLLVYFSRPEIARNREEMRIPEKRLKLAAQIRLYRRSADNVVNAMPSALTSGLGY